MPMLKVLGGSSGAGRFHMSEVPLSLKWTQIAYYDSVAGVNTTEVTGVPRPQEIALPPGTPIGP